MLKRRIERFYGLGNVTRGVVGDDDRVTSTAALSGSIINGHPRSPWAIIGDAGNLMASPGGGRV